jgi:hypothetical protein
MKNILVIVVLLSLSSVSMASEPKKIENWRQIMPEISYGVEVKQPRRADPFGISRLANTVLVNVVHEGKKILGRGCVTPNASHDTRSETRNGIPSTRVRISCSQ